MIAPYKETAQQGIRISGLLNANSFDVIPDSRAIERARDQIGCNKPKKDKMNNVPLQTKPNRVFYSTAEEETKEE